MGTANLLSFYNTLFSIEIAVFGIICAVVFVFIQLFLSTYSYKHIGHILKDKWLMLFFFFSITDLLATSLGSFFLSFEQHDMLPRLFFATDLIVTNQFYVFACWLLIFASIIVFVKLIFNNISYLQPHRALFLLTKNIEFSNVRDYLWRRYPLEVPWNLKMKDTIFFIDPEEKKRSKKAEKARLLKEEKALDVELKRVEKVIKTICNRVSTAEDPLVPVRDMMIQFIKKSDISSFEEASSILVSATNSFLKQLPAATSIWSPENDLAKNYSRHVIEILSTLLEVADKEGLISMKKSIIKTSYNISMELFDNKWFGEVDMFGEWWQKIADDSIGYDSFIFKSVIKYYREIGSKFMKIIKTSNARKSDENERLLENLFRYVGWLGERLMIKGPFEESPLFDNYSYSTDYDEYYNCIMSFGDLYNWKRPNLYPLIYFDVLIVIMRRLISIVKNHPDSNLSENIFSIAYAFASFAEKAIAVKHWDGASLAALRISEAYQELKDEGLNKTSNDVIKLLVRIGMLTAANKENEEKARFMSKSLDQWVIDELSKYNENIDEEVKESDIKTIGLNYEAKWTFITQLGSKMGTNFGLMFDPSTGIIYADNDPRRR